MRPQAQEQRAVAMPYRCTRRSAPAPFDATRVSPAGSTTEHVYREEICHIGVEENRLPSDLRHEAYV